MAKHLMLVDAAHPEETRVVVLSGSRLDEFDFETSTKKQIKGNIYLARVTRVEPSLQAAFVEYGGNRHGFLAFGEIHPDYYRIPVADRQAAVAAERAYEQAADAREDAERERDPTYGDRHVHVAPVPEEPEDVAHESAGSAERMAYAAPSETVRSPEIEPTAADANLEEPSLPDLRLSPDETGAPFPDAAADRIDPAAAAEPAPDEADESRAAAEAGGPSGLVPETTHEDRAAEVEHSVAEAESDVIETVGGDEIEEATRPRTRGLRHYKIQEVIKRRQIMLVQVAKEERGNKGAALTTYLSLAGRYCVLMPNTPRGGGVSRKITSASDRRRLKDLMSDLDVPDGMGVIVRTAGSERSKTEIKRDFEYLLRLWDEIRDLTLKSTAPALIYEEGNLIKRSIRDLYTRDIDEVIVDGEEGYRTAKAFMKMLMPSHAKRVKFYRDPTVPLFHRYQVEAPIDAIHSPVVQLRSGGYIVINPTEALVAIDVNSGRSTKERNIEETALKTNIEAAEEVARQLRLRDLAGLIVIDFIDMEEYRNRGAVERKLKEAMRYDRARIQLGRISPFGLLELSRQRLRPSLLEASTQPCPFCAGTGHIRSIESTALHVLRAIEEEGMHRRSAEIAVAAPSKVALYVLNQKRTALLQAESRFGLRVTISSDDALVPPAFRLDRLRALTPAEIATLPAFAPMPEPEEEEGEEEDEIAVEEEDVVVARTAAPVPAEPVSARAAEEDAQSRHRRRRRRGRRGEENREPRQAAVPAQVLEPSADAPEDGDEVAPTPPAPARRESGESAPGEEQKRRRRGRRGGRQRRGSAQRSEAGPAAAAPEIETIELVPPEPAPAETMEEVFAAPATPAERQLETASVPVAESTEHDSIALEPVPEPEPEPAAATASFTEPPAHEVTGPAANPRRGWWRR
jgi:ribonuclease E